MIRHDQFASARHTSPQAGNLAQSSHIIQCFCWRSLLCILQLPQFVPHHGMGVGESKNAFKARPLEEQRVPVQIIRPHTVVGNFSDRDPYRRHLVCLQRLPTELCGTKHYTADSNTEVSLCCMMLLPLGLCKCIPTKCPVAHTVTYSHLTDCLTKGFSTLQQTTFCRLPTAMPWEDMPPMHDECHWPITELLQPYTAVM